MFREFLRAFFHPRLSATPRLCGDVFAAFGFGGEAALSRNGAVELRFDSQNESMEK